MFARVRRALKGDPWSREELHDYIRQPETDLDAEEKSMLVGVLEVSETQVREVMVPRSQMVVIDIEQNFDEILAIIIESGHSRFPVIGEDRDEVLGVLLAKDLLRYFGSDKADDVPLLKLLRPASVIPESKRLNALLKEFRDSHNHMAIVVDEYGGVAGLLTIEDVLEEIVGEIEDEHDTDGPTMIRRPDGSVLADARTEIEELEKLIGVFATPAERDEIDTLGGIVFSLIDRVPRRHEVIAHPSGLEFEIVDADPRRVKRLCVRDLRQSGDE